MDRKRKAECLLDEPTDTNGISSKSSIITSIFSKDVVICDIHTNFFDLTRKANILCFGLIFDGFRSLHHNSSSDMIRQIYALCFILESSDDITIAAIPAFEKESLKNFLYFLLDVETLDLICFDLKVLS